MTPENTHIYYRRYKGCLECWNNKNHKIGKPLSTHCKNNHEYTPENTSTTTRGKWTVRVCKTCQAEARARCAARAKKKKAKIVHSMQCRAGHDLVGANVRIRADGSKQCVRCAESRWRMRNRLTRLGLFKTKTCPRGSTLEQKIAFYSSPPDADGCILWQGGRRRPIVTINGTAVPVRRYLWEKRTGTKLTRTQLVEARCGKEMCIREECFSLTTRKESKRIAKGVATATHTKRIRYHKDREKHLLSALEYVKEIRGQLHRHYGSLGSDNIEDLLQETLLAVYLASVNGKTIENTRSFMWSTAMNKARDFKRLAHFKRNVSLNEPRSGNMDSDGNETEADMEFEAPEFYDPARYFEMQEEHNRAYRLWRYVARGLPAKMRQALNLRMDELSQKEIAQVMKISENTVEQHLMRSYRIIRSRLDRRHGGIHDRIYRKAS
jgi:RNA polymerase sigma factor (sigma-70 family)